MKKLFITLALLTLISGCSDNTTHLSVVAPQNNHTFTAAELNRATVHRNVTASSNRGILLFIPLGFPNFDSALADALEQGGGNAMTNVTVTDTARWWILFGYLQIKITGDVINIPTSAN